MSCCDHPWVESLGLKTLQFVRCLEGPNLHPGTCLRGSSMYVTNLTCTYICLGVTRYRSSEQAHFRYSSIIHANLHMLWQVL